MENIENVTTHIENTNPSQETIRPLKRNFTKKSIKLNKLLLVGTGALMNATTCQQKESIPGIAHAIAIENI